jgi:hypothetical protein
MEAMILSMEGKSEADLDPRLKADTERFARFVIFFGTRVDFIPTSCLSDLEKVFEIMKRISSSSFMSRVRGHISHANEIQQCKDLLDQSFKAFQVRPFIVLYVTKKNHRDQVYNMIALRLDVLELKAPQVES